ncbi:MAG: methyltransferase domain-containing protein [Alphaproteobacteria bacterium]|nr:methyltransferase domain-containing protein [Alphaproteobacteria bacterium]
MSDLPDAKDLHASRPDYLDRAIAPYEQDPQKYSALWRQIEPDKVWAPLFGLFHKPPCALIDVAAGDGRDAQFFEAQGYSVTAVEPSAALRECAKKQIGVASKICWIDDAFPGLVKVRQTPFKMITVAAGFVHIMPEDQKASLASLYDIAEKGGRVAILLRDGKPDPQHLVFTANPDYFSAWAKEFGFTILRELRKQPDALGRKEVLWNYLMLERPN